MNPISTRKALSHDKRLTLHSAGTPWSEEHDGSHDGESPWLMSYLDFLTVLLVLFMFLYAYEKTQHSAPPPIKAAAVKTVAKPRPTQVKPPAKPAQPQENRQALAAPLVPAATVAASAPVLVDSTLSAPEPQVSATVAEPVASPPITAMPEPGPALIVPAKLADRIAVKQDAQTIQIEINDAILFAAGSAELSMEGALLLDELWPVLSSHAGAITVEGHTDNRPITTLQFPSNWELSSARAGTVTRHLIDLGLAANRITPVGRADTQPHADNASAEGRAQNRRVGIILHRRDR